MVSGSWTYSYMCVSWIGGGQEDRLLNSFPSKKCLEYRWMMPYCAVSFIDQVSFYIFSFYKWRPLYPPSSSPLTPSGPPVLSPSLFQSPFSLWTSSALASSTSPPSAITPLPSGEPGHEDRKPKTSSLKLHVVLEWCCKTLAICCIVQSSEWIVCCGLKYSLLAASFLCKNRLYKIVLLGNSIGLLLY